MLLTWHFDARNNVTDQIFNSLAEFITVSWHIGMSLIHGSCSVIYWGSTEEKL
jgi:hypothetical protein